MNGNSNKNKLRKRFWCVFAFLKKYFMLKN